MKDKTLRKKSVGGQHIHRFGMQCEVCIAERPQDHARRDRLSYTVRKHTPDMKQRDKMRKEAQA